MPVVLFVTFPPLFLLLVLRFDVCSDSVERHRPRCGAGGRRTGRTTATFATWSSWISIDPSIIGTVVGPRVCVSHMLDVARGRELLLLGVCVALI